eukprot:8100024-Prorocentrum_lima.AAC.1
MNEPQSKWPDRAHGWTSLGTCSQSATWIRYRRRPSANCSYARGIWYGALGNRKHLVTATIW